MNQSLKFKIDFNVVTENEGGENTQVGEAKIHSITLDIVDIFHSHTTKTISSQNKTNFLDLK